MRDKNWRIGERGLRPDTAPYGALLLRLALGMVFIAHALFKPVVLGFPVAAAFFAQHGFPGWTVYPVFAVELLGGLLLLGGVATRPAAVALLGVVAGAFRVHGPNGWNFASPNGGWEYLAVLAAGLVGLALLGPGAPRVVLQREVDGRTTRAASGPP